MVTAIKPTNRMTKNSTTPAGKTSKSRRVDPAEKVLDRDPNLKNAVAQIEKQFGEGAIMPLGSATAARIQGISTGSLSLDMALGGQGLPSGRIENARLSVRPLAGKQPVAPNAPLKSSTVSASREPASHSPHRPL